MADLIVEVDGKQILLKDVGDETEKAIAYLQSQQKELREKVITLESDLEGLEEHLSDWETKEKEWKEYREKSLPASEVEELVSSEVGERQRLWDEAKKRSPGIEIDYTLGATGIRQAVISSLNPDIDLEDKSPEFVEGLWQGLPAVLPTTEVEATEQLPSGVSSGKPVKAIAAESYLERYDLSERFV